MWSQVVAILLVSAPVLAQQRLLTLDDIYGPSNRVTFSGTPPPQLTWIDGTHYAWPEAQGDREFVDWMSVAAVTGNASPLFDAGKAQASLAATAGVASATASRAVHSRDLVFNRGMTAALLTLDRELYLLTFADASVRKLTTSGGDKEEATLSPDGSAAAFVRGHNLFLVEVSTGRETAVTQDGSAKVLNGKMDWVYEEEIYGRGTSRAYWWSPDSSRIAFLRIDDTPVSTYITVDDISYDPKVELWPYPRAGDPNPSVRLGVARTSGMPAEWVDLSKYASEDFLLVRVAWTLASRLTYEVQNRTQSWLDLNIVDLTQATASSKTLFRETSQFWINSEDQATPTWLADGSFVWLSERSGFRHAYHYRADGTLVRPVTSGRWEVREVHGVDERNGWLYFSATERTAIAEDIYRIRLNGSGLERLSKSPGTHDPQFSPDLAYYLDRWSAVMTPPQVRLHRADGNEIRIVHANAVAAFAQYRLSTPEFLQVRTRDGFVMEAMMIKPPDFDPRRKYPVYQFTYGGPHAPQVKNAWTLQTMYHQLLAQKGVIVWICDNRSASGKGIESTSAVYRRFGDSELRDIEDGLSWLKQQSYVDPSRIGIHGWSYGGFMTTYALTHSTSFVMGIAGGTVSDWRDYDTVYTERFLGRPQENQDGYRNSSPRFAASGLRGSLLLIHGAVDDNVHVQNTMQLVYELQKANKPFSLMLYPKSRHSVGDPALARHLREVMLDYTLQHLKP
jgi:dipeptidyl-peptidase-4